MLDVFPTSPSKSSSRENVLGDGVKVQIRLSSIAFYESMMLRTCDSPSSPASAQDSAIVRRMPITHWAAMMLASVTHMGRLTFVSHLSIALRVLG